LLARARTHGEELDEALLERFRTTVDEELTDPSGSLLTALYRRYGMANTLVTTTAVDAGQALFVRPAHPEAAARTWEIVRREHVTVTADGVDVHSPGIGRRLGNLDPGNGDRARTFLLATVAGIARELGDEEVATGLLARAEEEAPVETRNGVKRFARASNFTNGVVALTRADRADGWYDLVRTGPPRHWLEGPLLAEAPYPGVLVARATTDGDALSLVLRPGEGPGHQTVRLGRLRPTRTYDVRGGATGEVVADAAGRAELTLELEGRTEVEVVPRG